MGMRLFPSESYSKINYKNKSYWISCKTYLCKSKISAQLTPKLLSWRSMAYFKLWTMGKGMYLYSSELEYWQAYMQEFQLLIWLIQNSIKESLNFHKSWNRISFNFSYHSMKNDYIQINSINNIAGEWFPKIKRWVNNLSVRLAVATKNEKNDQNR